MKLGYRLLFIVPILTLASTVHAQLLTTAFTYQGLLRNAGSPAHGPHVMAFQLYDALSGGNAVGPALVFDGVGGNPPPVQVTDGLFTVVLDFGPDVFTGNARWLEITVVGTSLSPRQRVTPAPYALALPGLYTQQNATSPNVIGGHSMNEVTAGVVGATIAGGGLFDVGDKNRVTDSFGTVGGGRRNRAGDAAGSVVDRMFATVGGGWFNTASGAVATIGGGEVNTASGPASAIGGGTSNITSGIVSTVGGGASNTASGFYSTVGGGEENDVSNDHSTIAGGEANSASGVASTIGGGSFNTAPGSHSTISGGGINYSSGLFSAIGGGEDNEAVGNHSTVAGGFRNTTSNAFSTVGGGWINTASADWATVGGGSTNTASGLSSTVGGGASNTASGAQSTVPGGVSNTAAGAYSLAAGRRAKANHQGAFVWADSTNADFPSGANNQFRVRAAGGAQFYTNAGLTAGVQVASGGSSWSSLSDRNAKENFTPVDPVAVLERVAAMPITTWNYRAQDASIRHMGPMAQDFYAAFGLGEDELRISTINADGVLFAAVQGAHELIRRKDAEIGVLSHEVESLRAELAELRGLLQSLATGEKGATR